METVILRYTLSSTVGLEIIYQESIHMFNCFHLISFVAKEYVLLSTGMSIISNKSVVSQ